jgi:hypothetical protein
MKRYLTAILLVLLMALSVHPLQAQSIEKIKLKRNYRTDYLDLK